ncbi:STAS/SEC14 domain-containing protein, partial [Chloroflexota bacterium]
MLEKLSESSGDILGYKVIGKITKQDYSTVIADIQVIGQEQTCIGLLLDLIAFKGEETKSRSAKLSFRSDYQKKISKLAVVGDKQWHDLITEERGQEHQCSPDN